MIRALILASISVLMLQSAALAASPEYTILTSEFNRLRNHVMQLRPDGVVGGLYKEKFYGDYSLLWNVSEDPNDSETIRFYREDANGKVFSVTYHKNKSMVQGRMVLRRFIGPEPTGWRNHTVDLATGQYYGSQGAIWLRLNVAQEKLLRDWDITPIEN